MFFSSLPFGNCNCMCVSICGFVTWLLVATRSFSIDAHAKRINNRIRIQKRAARSKNKTTRREENRGEKKQNKNCNKKKYNIKPNEPWHLFWWAVTTRMVIVLNNKLLSKHFRFVYDVNLFVHIHFSSRKKEHIANLSSYLQCQMRHIVKSNCTGWIKYSIHCLVFHFWNIVQIDK